MNTFTSRDNILLFISLFQCLGIFVGSLFMMVLTQNQIAYYLAILAGILSMLSLQCTAGLYEKGLFPGNYDKTISYYNDYIHISAFNLLFSILWHSYQLYPIAIILLSILCAFELHRYYDLTQ